MSMISRLGVVLGLDSAEFNAGLGKAEAGLKTFVSNSVASKLSIAAVGAALTYAATEAINFADKINDVAKANEVAVGTVLNLSKALTINGGESENTSKMFSSFTNKIDEAAKGGLAAQKSFASLGITLNDLRKLTQEQLLQKAMTGFTDPKMADAITRNATAVDLFGKAAKGVDISGLANDFLNNKDSFYKQEEAFKAIGKAMDSYDVALQKTKERMATDLAPIITGSISFFDTMINGWTRLEGHINDAAKAQEKMIARSQGVSTWKPAATIYDKITPSEASKYGGSQRDVEAAVDPEQKKRIEAAKRLTEAMAQQSMEYGRQLDLVGQQESVLYKIMIEFAKGGKYAGQENTAMGQKLIQQAIAIDQKKKEVELAKEIYDIQVADAKEQAKKIKAGEDALQLVIERRQAERDAFDLATQDVQIAAERLDYEKQLAGLSDTQREKALEFFDLSRRMKRMAEQDVGLDSDQLEKRQQAQQDRIMANEENKRAQRTFQAGWNNAYNNFVERASDSAALAADAFNSMARSMESALDSFVRTGKLNFSEFASSIISDLIRIQLKSQVMGLFGGLFGGGDATGGIGNIFTSSSTNFANGGGILGFLGFADGGNPPVGVPSIVGERGPELFVPKTAGTVVPNHSLSSMMGSQPQVVYNGTVVQNMSAIDTQSAVQFLSANKNAVWSANMSAQRGLPMSR